MPKRANQPGLNRSERPGRLGPLLALREKQLRKQIYQSYETGSHSALEREFMLGTVLIVLLVLMLIGALPAWPHSRNWGYGPTGGLGVVLAILVIVLLLGWI